MFVLFFDQALEYLLAIFCLGMGYRFLIELLSPDSVLMPRRSTSNTSSLFMSFPSQLVDWTRPSRRRDQ
jgi:hypothetical protein